MPTYFVSRHSGAIVWAARHGVQAELISHLNPSMLIAGDTVLGTLPVHIVAELTARGVAYLHLEIDVPEVLRGQDLSAEDMARLGAKLVPYRAERLQSSAIASHAIDSQR